MVMHNIDGVVAFQRYLAGCPSGGPDYTNSTRSDAASTTNTAGAVPSSGASTDSDAVGNTVSALHSAGGCPRFATLDEAKAACSSPQYLDCHGITTMVSKFDGEYQLRVRC